ncbi:MAG TPA: sugar ABC transporter permease [Spirochaetia bacterium]|nr:sugar ABC transporter permease [Spirochaetia bacterium]
MLSKSFTFTRRLKVIGFLFVLPVILYFGLIYYLPLYKAFDLSFHEILPKGKIRFAGLATYMDVLKDPLFWTSVQNTVLFTFLSTALIVLFGLLIAIGLHSIAREGLRNFYTVFYVLPTLVSFAAAGSIWEWIFHAQFGLVNMALSNLGIPTLKFLDDAVQVIPSLAVINLWVRVGFAILIILAGLQSIPSSYFEAATVDGATSLQLTWNVTLPLLIPQIAVVSLLEVIFGFKVFDVVYVTTSGGPASASYMVLFYFYDNAFRFYRQDRASVIAVIMFMALLVFSILQRRLVRGRRYEI